MLAASAEFARRFAEALAEDAGKIKLIAKAKPLADLSDSDFGIEKLIFCF